jgi:two-component system, sporulation sensor kinase A
MIDAESFTGFDENLEAKHLLTALRHSADLISRHADNGAFLYASPAAFSLLGYSPQELYRKSLFEFCHPADILNLKNLMEKPDKNDSERISFRFRRKEGDYIWLETVFTSIPSSNEMICISRDMTQRFISEEEILENQEKYRLLVEFARDTIGMITEEGIWTYINDEGKKLLGTASIREIIGTSLFQYITDKDKTYLTNFFKANKSINFEMNLIRSDRQIRKAEIQLIPTVFKNRKMFQIIIKDLTGQKKTEERLQNAEKLSVVGQLAAAIAHEIRNPLTAIKGFTQLIGEKKPNEYTKVVIAELERIESIVTDLLVLAKPQATNLEQTNIVNLVKSVVTLLNTQAIMCNTTINMNFQAEEFIINCEIDKIKQVLINIIKNAIEAMPSGGEICIDVKQNQNFVHIIVRDQGVGIPEDRIHKLGEPFYSTKEKGTGLGLMICYKILKNHGGNLHIKSKEKEGTTVTIMLPLV